MKRELLAFDGSSLLWRGLLGSKDIENGFEIELENGKKKWINSAQHGFDQVTAYLHNALKQFKRVPIDTILVLEGAQSKSRRQLISLTYKAKSDKVQQQYDEFHKCRDMIRQFWLDLGGQVMVQDFAEGDDTLGWLAENTEEDLVIYTYDNDISVLNTPKNAYGARVRVWVNGNLGENKYGAFDTRLITLYKSLVGDTSDSIKGCPGFGETAWHKLWGQYGEDGLWELDAMVRRGDLSPLVPLLEDPDNKLLRKIYDQGPTVCESYNLARIRPAWVNTLDDPLHWQPGMVRPLRKGDDLRFKQWYGRKRLVTGDIFVAACDWAWPLILQSPEVALDIETSSSDESDEWLANFSKDGDAESGGIDVLGHRLTGLSITFGDNNQYSLYFSVDHARTNNCDSEQLRQFIARITAEAKKDLIIHNMNFELTVLFQEWGARQMNNGYHGFLPRVLDTALSCAYVDENLSRGLKFRSERFLKYEQQTYKETTELSGFAGELPPGGRLIMETEPTYKRRAIGTGQFEPVFDDITGEVVAHGDEIMRYEDVLDDDGERVVETPPVLTYRYRMNELTGAHVRDYGCDDTICTIALHNFNRLHCQLEHQWQIYKDVEIDAAYLHAQSFLSGISFSLQKMNELSAADDKVYEAAWGTMRNFLIENGWAGTAPPAYTADITPAQVKEAFYIVTGRTLNTAMRTLSKIVTFIREIEDEPIFAGLLDDLINSGRAEPFQKYVKSKFKGEPQFNYGSVLQKQKLLYEVMDLPVRVRNRPTDKMRMQGVREGSPKSDTLAIQFALLEAEPEQKPVLDAMLLMGMVNTRRNLFYEKYPSMLHWRTGRIHSSHNQSSTNTRRASSSRPNTQQWPVSSKIKGQEAKFRQTIVPHRPDAVVVSMDFAAQELRIIADYSRDPNMVACYIGDNLKDLHSLTGLQAARALSPEIPWTYDLFIEAVENENHDLHVLALQYRKLGKLTNFGSEFGAQAKKLSEILLTDVETAQVMLEAKGETFPISLEWKASVIDETVRTGIARTKMGAVRHLGPALRSPDKFVRAKAERQGVNFKVQGSAAEMTKLAEGRMWKAGLFTEFDARCYGPCHDEVIASVLICDLHKFLPRMHACMVAPYGGMFIPIESSISFGHNLFDQIEIGKHPTEDAISRGVAKLNT